jgi:hypothetical protein
MKKLILAAALVAAAAGLSCNRSSKDSPPAPAPAPAPAPVTAAAAPAAASAAGNKKTWIYITKNYNKGTGAGQFNTDCLAVVGTETMGTRQGYKVTWQVWPGNGKNDDDRCEGLVNESVSLSFVTDVFGKGVMKVLKANPGGVIQGTVSEDDDDIAGLLNHHYHVRINNVQAGPDPIIVVNCGSCGPPPPNQ